MSKKEVKFTCGNYLVTVALSEVLEVTGLLASLVLAGITQILQRKPASAWEKIAAGYEKRPSGFERNSIAYDEAKAESLRVIMAGTIVSPAVLASEGVEGSPAVKLSGIATVTVVEYVPEQKEYKFREETALIARHESEDDVESWLETKVGFAGDHIDSDTDSGYSLEALKAVKAYIAKMTKGL